MTNFQVSDADAHHLWQARNECRAHSIRDDDLMVTVALTRIALHPAYPGENYDAYLNVLLVARDEQKRRDERGADARGVTGPDQRSVCSPRSYD